MRYISLLIIMTITMNPLLAKEHVVLLHGLARTTSSMEKMENKLSAAGYTVHNLGYDSRRSSVEELAIYVANQIEKMTVDATQVHIVTHSLGGILVRQMQATAPLPKLNRVVMLSPPNAGSEVVDKIGHWWLFKKINGPAGQQLGTSRTSLVNQLGAINFECGVITGDRSINWINSLMIPGKDDGKVSVTSAKLKGLADYKVVHVSHPYIMKKNSVIEDVLYFLRTGKFK
jgi:esterase/lipase